MNSGVPAFRAVAIAQVDEPRRCRLRPRTPTGRGAWVVDMANKNTAAMPTRKIDFEIVRDIAKALPDVEESSLHGAPSLKVSGRLLTCPALHKSAEPDSLVVRIGFERRAELLAAEPGIYYVTDHYVNHPAVLVRLGQIDRDSLRDLLELAWSFVSSKKKAIR